MTTIEILLQGEAILDIEPVVLGDGATTRDLLAEAARLRRQPIAEGEFLVFIEGEDVPLDLGRPIPTTQPGEPMRMHVHRCRTVLVFVTFNGETEEHRLGPATTVAAAKEWAAITAFHMTPVDAAEHVLQLGGTTTRPEPDTHIGSLVTGKDCQVRFDLVPSKRVEG